MINLHDEWGFNAVRIGTMWTAVQPHNNSHVQTAFLEKTKQLITDLYQHGLYALLDGHQDLLGPDMCGEGLPFWATNRALELRKFDRFSPLNKFPMPLPFQLDHDNITGFPNKSQCVEHLFIDYYSTFESSNSFAGLYFEQEM
jgi:endoglycosylceramidase